MRAKKNEPVEHLEATGLVSRNGIQIAGGYFTNTIDTSLLSNSTSSPTLPPVIPGVPITLQFCLNGAQYNIDIYSIDGTAYQGTLHYPPSHS